MGSKAFKFVLFVFCVAFSLIGACFTAEWALGTIGYKSFLENGNSFSASWPMKEQICQARSIAEIEEIGRSMSGNGFDVHWAHDPEIGYITTRTAHGFNDSKNFNQDYGDFERFMVLGDSFAYGMSADEGSGWVDLLNQYYEPKKTIFFNTGIPGYGQWNQLAVLKKYHSVIRPHGVILLFCLNDFDNNRIGRERKVLPGLVMDTYEYDRRAPNGVARVGEQAILERYKRNIGCMDTKSSRDIWSSDFWSKTWDQALFGTRLGRVIWIRILKKDEKQTRDDRATHEVTKQALSEISDYLKTRGTPLYAAIIPDLGELKKNQVSGRQKKIRLIFEELSIPVLDLHSQLSLRDYIQVQDGHWNNLGHSRVYEKFKSCLDRSDRMRPGGFCN